MTQYRLGTTYIGAFSDGAEPPEGAVECPPPASALQEWDGSAWVDGADALAAERAAMVVSRFQAKAALAAAGHLATVEALIANSDALTQLAWAETIEWRRNSPMIAAMAGPDGLDLTETEIDALFRAAAQIEA